MKKKNEKEKERKIIFCVWRMRERKRDKEHFVCEKTMNRMEKRIVNL